jgi:hypothetical protein
LRQSVLVDGSTYSRVLLHLLERVEALEARPIPGSYVLAADCPATLPAPEAEGPSLAEIAELTWQHTSDLGDLRIGVAPDDGPALVAAVLARWGRPAAPPAPEPGEVGELLAANGVFKGSHGIEGLLNADAFWEQQQYGTRLYYGDGIADYLHRGVLRSAAALLQQQESRIATLRSALADCGRAARAAIGDDCSDAFLLEVPREVRLAVAKADPVAVPVPAQAGEVEG